jgi:hypothetical protein
MRSSPSPDVWRLSRGQNPVDPEQPDILQRSERVGGNVEGAVERGAEGTGELPQPGVAVVVYRAVPVQYTKTTPSAPSSRARRTSASITANSSSL